jgi:hypothetical protein
MYNNVVIIYRIVDFCCGKGGGGQMASTHFG